ncbi:DNA mismatch repair protein MutL [Pseudolycoriella hygida]|uniref:5-aminolevulinate synthase n=1 Tax=Pseudolycoriella hygida TaxID=35572 RepID=A0A9Q0S4M9_9DIPT|nr:DNA mismatch repair protein MutL [Pseudolycoriella hygida]
MLLPYLIMISVLMQVSKVFAASQITNLIMPISYFINHEQQLKKITEYLSKGKKVSIIGTSGIGKSQLARIYAHKNKTNYEIIWFFDCNLDLKEEFVKLAKQINQTFKTDIDEGIGSAKEKVLEYLKQQQKWLLIFDNLKIGENEKVKEIINWQHNGDIMFCSQDHANLPHIVEIPLLDRENTINLINHLLVSKNDKDTEFLIKTFSGYPILTVQGVQLLNKIKGLNKEEYKKKIYQAADKIESNINMVLKDLTPSAIDLLSKTALINNQSFSKQFLAAITNNQNSLTDDIQQLSNFMVISQTNHDPDNPIFEMHDIIAEKLRAMNGNKNNKIYLEEIISNFVKTMPKSVIKAHTFRNLPTIPNNLKIIAKNAANYDIDTYQLMGLNIQLFSQCINLADADKAKQLVDWFNINDKQGNFKLWLMNNDEKAVYATYLSLIGSYYEPSELAREYYVKYKEVLDNVEGYEFLKNHVLFSMTLINIDSGQLQEAEQNIQLMEKIFNNSLVKNIDVVLLHFAKARLFFIQKKYAAALEQLDILTKVLFQNGEDGMASLFSYRILKVMLLNALGRYQEAYLQAQQLYDLNKQKSKNQGMFGRIYIEFAKSKLGQGKLNDALEYINKAITMFLTDKQNKKSKNTAFLYDKTLAGGYLVQGEVFFAKRKFKESIAAFKEANIVYSSLYGKYLKNIQQVSDLYLQGAKAAYNIQDLMTSKIKFLSESTINQIAAGEVIERPASVIKELVENSLDARSTKIDITLEQAGKNLIIISDNGMGMSVDDLTIAIERHTTSKLDETDLLNINSFGFRGEALPSIGAISKMHITSKLCSHDKAYQIKVIGGTDKEIKSALHNEGTRIEIRDLFFATPARLKFLRSDKVELAACLEIVKKIALAHPWVSISLSHDEKNLLKVKGHEINSEDIFRNRIIEILGHEFMENAAKIDLQRPEVSIYGFTSIPTFNRASSLDQFLFVNNRPVKDKLLQTALRVAYQDYLARDRHPVTVLFLKINPLLVDVNVHPAKTEVRFHDPNTIRGLLISSIKDALATKSHIVSTSIATTTLGLFKNVNTFNQANKEIVINSISDNSESSNYKAQNSTHFSLQQPLIKSTPYAKVETTKNNAYFKDFKSKKLDDISISDNIKDIMDSREICEDPISLEPLYRLGAARAQLHGTYIISQTHDSIIIVDQHAAHERLGYEKIKQMISQNGLIKQRLLIPEIIELPDENRANLLYDQKTELSQLGLTIEKFGERSIIVSEIPSLLEGANIVQLIHDLADNLSDLGENISLIQLIEHKEGRYREFVPIQRQADNFPSAWYNDKDIVMWCTNDYLGMSKHPCVTKAASEAIAKYGIGSGGTRNIGGNNSCILELEEELADLHHTDKALVFTSGYVANDTTLTTLAKIAPEIVFFSDELNHASIISGIRNSRAEKHIYRHLDMVHLEELLKKIDINRPKIIVFESAYSMDGLFSPIKTIIDLANKYNALTFIDEVHTVGLYGARGAGIAELQECSDKIDIIQGTLGKAYGAIGGYIAANRQIIDSIRLTASGFIFTTSLPPVISAAATASIRHLKNSKVEREAYRQYTDCKLSEERQIDLEQIIAKHLSHQDKDALMRTVAQKYIDEGIQYGVVQGIEQGATNKAIAIARKMLEQKSSLDFISSVTGLDKSFILSLAQS